MTLEEQKAWNALVEAHNKYMDLPMLHSEDKREWVLKMHDLQRMILCRTEQSALIPKDQNNNTGKP